jgi:hypothetical protein
MLGVLTDQLLPKFPSEEDAEQEADDFLRFCAGRAWVLTEVGSDTLQPIYGFVHRTFLEFFAASQLVKNSTSAGDLSDVLVTYSDDSTKQVVASLAIQIWDQQRGTVDEVLSRLTDDSTGLNPRPHLLRMAVLALNNVKPSYAVLERIAHRSFDMAADVTAIGRRGGRDNNGYALLDVPLWELIGIRSIDNAEHLARALAPHVVERCLGDPADTSAGILYHFLTAEMWDSAASSEISRLLRADGPSGVAVNWQEILFSPSPELVRTLGVGVLYASTRFGPVRLGSVAAAAITSALEIDERRSGGTISNRDVVGLLDAICELGESGYLTPATSSIASSAVRADLAEWDRILSKITLGAMASIDSSLRAAVILFAYPPIRALLRLHSDHPLRALAYAGDDAARLSDAQSIVEMLELPKRPRALLLQLLRG